MSLGKGDFVKKIAGDAKISNAQAERAFSSVIDGISGALKKGERVTFVGFGSFTAVSRPARKGRNPQTGKEIKIPARKAVRFAAGASLKETVNKKK